MRFQIYTPHYSIRTFRCCYKYECSDFVFKKYLDNRWYFHFIIEQLHIIPLVYVLFVVEHTFFRYSFDLLFVSFSMHSRKPHAIRMIFGVLLFFFSFSLRPVLFDMFVHYNISYSLVSRFFVPSKGY